MPAASIDLFLASSAMILLVVGSIYGVDIVVEPYLGKQNAHLERYQQIGRYMLLSRGEPEGWGVDGVPTSLGFSDGGTYELDIDKVTRLNPSNAYSVNYSRLWETLGIDDVSFRIRVDTPFNLTMSLSSSQIEGGNTTYAFEASVTRCGYPLPTTVRYYVAVRDFNDSRMGVTDINGLGSVEFSIPNSLNGTALLIGFARLEQSIVSYGVLPFAHNSTLPEPAGTFANLSPLNHALNVNLTEGANIVNTAVFSLGYMFKIAGSGESYVIPRLLDASPMVLVVTGTMDSSHWAEWVAYPQVPLAVGAEMSDDYSISDVTSVSYMVEVKGALYRFEARFRSPTEDD